MDNKEMEMKELDLDEMVKVTGGVLNPAEKDFSEFWEKMPGGMKRSDQKFAANM